MPKVPGFQHFHLHWVYETFRFYKAVFLNRLAGHIRKQDWFIVIVELLVVIVGLVMAFQIDRWRDEVAERKLQGVYIQRLIEDIESDIPNLKSAINLANMRKNYAELLMEVVEDPSVAAAKPASFLLALDQASFTYSPTLRKVTFEDLRSTGNMRLLGNQDMKNKIHDYYRYDESQAQFRSLQFSVEFQHFKLANGVRSNRQMRYLQDKWLLIGPDAVDEVNNTDPGDPEEIMAAAERLRNKPELVSWLSQLRAMQMEQLKSHNNRMDLANTAIDSLSLYSESIKR